MCTLYIRLEGRSGNEENAAAKKKVRFCCQLTLSLQHSAFVFKMNINNSAKSVALGDRERERVLARIRHLIGRRDMGCEVCECVCL